MGIYPVIASLEMYRSSYRCAGVAAGAIGKKRRGGVPALTMEACMYRYSESYLSPSRHIERDVLNLCVTPSYSIFRGKWLAGCAARYSLYAPHGSACDGFADDNGATTRNALATFARGNETRHNLTTTLGALYETARGGAAVGLNIELSAGRGARGFTVRAYVVF